MAGHARVLRGGQDNRGAKTRSAYNPMNQNGMRGKRAIASESVSGVLLQKRAIPQTGR